MLNLIKVLEEDINKGDIPANTLPKLLSHVDFTNSKYGAVNQELQSVYVTSKMSMTLAWLILHDDYLYEWLIEKGLDVGYFAIAFYNYICVTGNFKEDVFVHAKDFLQNKTSGQDLFNVLIRQATAKLGVFYG